MNKTLALIIGTLVLLAAILSGLVYVKLTQKPLPEVIPTELVVQNDNVDVKVTYPVIPGTSEGVKNANASIRADIGAKVSRFESDAKENAPIGTDLPKEVKSTVTGSPAIEDQTDRYISIFMGMEWYLRGAAHPSHTIDTYVYDFEQDKLVSPREFFKDGSDYLGVLSRLSKEDLLKQSREGDLGFIFQEDMVTEGTLPTAENFKRILPLKDGLAIYFDEYQVAPYAAGPQQVVIPYSKLQDIIDQNGVLGVYLKK